MGQSSAFQLSADASSGSLSPGSRPSGGVEALRAAGPASPPEEDPERTKHSKMRAPGVAAGAGSAPDGYLTRILAPVFSPRVRKETENTQEVYRGAAIHLRDLWAQR